MKRWRLVGAWLALGAPAAMAAPAAAPLDACYALLADTDYAGAARCAQDDAGASPAARFKARIESLVWNAEAQPAVAAALRHDLDAAHAAPWLRAHLDIADALLGPEPAKAVDLAKAELARAQAAADAEQIAEAQSSLAEAYVAAHRNDDALAALDAARAAWRDRPALHARWHEYAALLRAGAGEGRAGRLDASAARYDDASALAAAVFGADSAPALDAALQRSHVYEEQGRLREELDLRQHLLARAQQRFGARHALTAEIEASVGSTLGMLGDYAGARPYYERAERTLAALPGVHWRQRAVILNNFANSLQESGDLDGALARQRAVLALAAQRPGTERLRAVLLSNMGNTEFSLRRYDDADAHFRAALALREQVDGAEAPGLAFSIEGLGSVALARQQYAEAQRRFERALDLRRRNVGDDHPLLARCRFAIALARWGQGDLDGAFARSVAIAQAEQRVLSHLATEFVERQSQGYRDQLVPATALAVTLAQQRGDAASLATAWALTMRERGLIARNEARRLAAARAAADPAQRDAWDQWRHATTAYAEAWAGKADAATLERLGAEAERAEQALWDRVGQTPANDAALPSPAQLAAALPAGGQLIALAEGLRGSPAQVLQAGNHFDIDWYAFDLAADAVPRLRRLGADSALGADARAWYAALRDPGIERAELRRRGLAVRGELLDPLRRAAARTLFVVPQGDVYRLDLAALPDGEGYLIERGIDVHTLAHESDLLLAAAPAIDGRVLLAGAPDFPVAAPGALTRQLCLRAPEQGFTRLDSAQRELDDLKQLFAAPTLTDLRGSSATREGVLRALPQAQVAHLATHGFSLDASCSAAPTRAVTLESAAAAKLGAAAPTPALSGLAFSGARVAAGEAPGVLSAADLAALDLSALNWVALSACDSGLGPIGRDEGVFGMRRALRLAGARTVVMSLWEVDDAATADLMRALYQARFAEHRSVPAAMGVAMRATLTQRRAAGQSDHPFYWAAFVGEGGWR